MTTDNVVLVGVDGSLESLEALRWAVQHAAHSGARVHLVCAYSLPSFTAGSLDGGYAGIDDSAIRAGAQKVIEEAEAIVREANVPVTSALETGDPTGVLVELSREASLAVVGTRGGGGFADRLLGAVSSALPAHAHCPVTVVPQHKEGSAFTPVRRIVVGVDGSDSSRKALNAAVVAAHLWNAELTAIAAVPIAAGSGALAWLPAAVDHEEVVNDLRAGLDRTIAAVTKDYPDVRVRRHVLDGNAAELMAEFSTAVDLIVVGSRGRGGFSGILLGSTSQAVLSHASCPVLVVPQRVREEPARRGNTPWPRA